MIFDYSDDLKKTENEISKFSKTDVDGYKRLLSFSEKIFNVGFLKLSHTPFHNFWFMIRQIPILFKLKSYLSVFQLVSKFIKNENLRQALSIQPLLLGGNPIGTTSIYNLIHYLERKWGVHYSIGGTGALVNALKKLMIEEKISINTNSEVTKILTEDQKVIGVEINNSKRFYADKVVVNADPAFTYNNLLKSKYNRKWNKHRIQKLDYSMGLFVIYFGTKKKYPKIAHHTIWMGKRYQGLLNDIFKKKILAEDFSLYLHRPTATDSKMAPKNCDSFYVLSPVPNLLGNINWKIEGKKYQDKILKALEKTILPDLSKNLDVCFFMTPQDFKNDYLSLNGSGFSISPIFQQSAWFRFHNKSENFKNLYFSGAGSHPGAGVPGVISSAKVVENIIKNEG